jgi:glutamate synthase domain-containing protein 3
MKLIEANGLHYRELNEIIRKEISRGEREFKIIGVTGQRYIAAGIKQQVKIVIEGIPGNDLGAFMQGPIIEVRGNGQDGVGNTMSEGKIVIHGRAGDIIGYGMRGGKIFIRDEVGYRVGIHMKAYGDSHPAIVVGGSARDFLGEYMAGGLIIILALNGDVPVGKYCGTGMHGGKIYVRGNVERHLLGKEVAISPLSEEDEAELKRYLEEYFRLFGGREEISPREFIKIAPLSHRPYGSLYTH